MTRLSPAVGRTVAVLNFLAAHPEQSFTLTDIVNSLKLSRATCHGLLAALVESGYLYRDGDKAYMLGPTLASIGRIAMENFSPLQAARPEMRALADAFDVVCSAAFRDRDDIVIRERAASASHLNWPMAQPLRSPFAAPPLGALFLVSSSPSDLEEWFDGVSPPFTSAGRENVRKCLERLRQQGHIFGIRSRYMNTENDQYRGTDLPRSTFMVDPIEDDSDYELAYAIAPVFDARRRVVFLLVLSGFTGTHSGRQLREIGKRLLQSGERIESFITARPSAA